MGVLLAEEEISRLLMSYLKSKRLIGAMVALEDETGPRPGPVRLDIRTHTLWGTSCLCVPPVYPRHISAARKPMLQSVSPEDAKMAPDARHSSRVTSTDSTVSASCAGRSHARRILGPSQDRSLGRAAWHNAGGVLPCRSGLLSHLPGGTFSLLDYSPA